MYLTRSEPKVERDGKIKTFIEIKEGTLLINDKHKFEDGKWYYFGDDQKWYFLGLGANPNIEADGEDIFDQELFNNVFDEIKE